MPSIRNINTPKSLNRRVTFHKRRMQKLSGPAPTPTPRYGVALANTKSRGSGVLRIKTTAAKQDRKKLRNKTYAAERLKRMTAAELAELGEVEMVDIADAPVSRRQQKLNERKEKVAAENAKTLVVRKEQQVEWEKKKAEKAAAALEGETGEKVEVMEIDA